MDVYLAGYANRLWRDKFIEQIDNDVEVYDPWIENYVSLNGAGKADQVARELEMIEECELIVFYLCKEWESRFSTLQLGDAVGRGKQVVICISDAIDGEAKIRRYCEYRGVIVTTNLEDLVTTVEEYLAEVELCSADLE